MKRLWLLICLALLMPALANAEDTLVLYNQYEIPSSFYGGQQIGKDYYIKESLKRVKQKNPYLLKVKTYTKVTNRGGSTEYRITYHFNCKTEKYTMVRHWSTGYGDDKGLMVDGKWHSISDYEELVKLMKEVCPNK